MPASALMTLVPTMAARPRVLIVGGGPVGLEAAVSCSLSGFAVTLCEKGPSVGSAVSDWGHVRLFSSNELNCSPDGLRALSEVGCAAPDPAVYPTGAQYCAAYLQPLATWLERRDDCDVIVDAAVESISRGSLLKGEAIKAVGANARDDCPFAALVDVRGEETLIDGLAAVIDCSGTYGNGNNLGRGGAPAMGERKLRAEPAAAVADCFFDRLPDVLGSDLPSFMPPEGAEEPAGGTSPQVVSVVLVGGGYSAATTLRSLLEHARSRAGSVTLEVDWLLRRPAASGEPYAVVPDDPLPSRDELVQFANGVAAGETRFTAGTLVRVHRGATINAVKRDPTTHGLVVQGTCEGGGEPAAFELRPRTLVSHVGFRPSYDLARELQVHVCYASEGPMKLAASLLAARVAAESSGDAAAAGDCLKQAAPGPELLTTPEPNFHVLGSKSYGRASSFLLMIGHKQVEAVVTLLKKALLAKELS